MLGRVEPSTLACMTSEAAPALPFAVRVGEDLTPVPEATTPGPPTHCVEHSGGDNRCPGG